MKSLKRNLIHILIASCFTVLSFGCVSNSQTANVSKQEVSTVSQVKPQTKLYKVLSVMDGDTIVVTKDGKQTTVRLYGIDTPELNQLFGENVKFFLTGKIFEKNVTIVPHTIDKYERVVAEVFFDDVNISEELVQKGYAWVYRKYCHKIVCDQWLKYEKMAKTKRIGLWTNLNPIPPWDFRKGVKNNVQEKKEVIEYHGNIGSLVFHKKSCKYYNCENCTKIFFDRDEAIKVGYRPCGLCKP